MLRLGLPIIILTIISSTSVFCAPNYVFTNKVEAFFNQNESASYKETLRNKIRRGDNLEEVIIQTIKMAKNSVYVAVQELRLPGIAKALAKKKKEGLDVRVILENSYNFTFDEYSKDPNSDEAGEHESSRYLELSALIDINGDAKFTVEEMNQRDAIRILKNAKVQIKDDTDDGTRGSGLMHHKFVIVDHKTLIVSSANFTMSGIHGDLRAPNTLGNANALIRLESIGLADYFKDEFLMMWGGTSGRGKSRFGNSKSYRPAKSFRLGSTRVQAQFSPTPRHLDWSRSVNGLIGKQLRHANKSVDMLLFVFSEQHLANILKQRRKEVPGLKISGLVERNFASVSYSEVLDLWGLKLLDDRCTYEPGNSPWRPHLRSSVGVPKLIRGDKLHHKFAVIDDSKVVFGSQNWSDSANYTNDENVIVIENKRIAALFKKEFRRLARYANYGPSKALLHRIQAMKDTCGIYY